MTFDQLHVGFVRMQRLWGLGAVVLAAIACDLSELAAREWARTTVLGHEVILASDGSWAFSNPEMSTDRMDLVERDFCFSAEAGRITLCDLFPKWALTEISVDEYGAYHSYNHRDGSAALSVSHFRDGGHEGEIDYYRDDLQADGWGDRLMTWFLQSVLGADTSMATVSVLGDIVVIEEANLEFDQSSYHTLEIIGPKESLYVELTEFTPSEETSLAATMPEYLKSSIMLNGTPLLRHLQQGGTQ